MGRVLADYVTAIGWGVVGAISMAAGLAILLKVFDWLTPINEWAEIQKGNLSDLQQRCARSPRWPSSSPAAPPRPLPCRVDTRLKNGS